MHAQPGFDQNERARQLNAIAWAISIIWVGIAILADLPWGWFILGIGVIIGANGASIKLPKV